VILYTIVLQGFRDLLLIGNQSRRHIFDLVIARPELLYEEVIEVNERVVLVKEGEGEGLDDADFATMKGKISDSIFIGYALQLGFACSLFEHYNAHVGALDTMLM
jgi:N-methylhydantoinase A/oxoprolinase/acetone carboxylase beta subunit